MPSGIGAMSRPNADEPVTRPTAATQVGHLGSRPSDPARRPPSLFGRRPVRVHDRPAAMFAGAPNSGATNTSAVVVVVLSVSVYQIQAPLVPLLDGRTILGR